MRGCCSFLLLCFTFSAVLCRTIFVEINDPTVEEVAFLKKYGYILEPPDLGEFAYSEETLSEAVKKMQAFAGLPQTGNVDPETKKLFKMKRCGVKDMNQSHRNRRFIIQQGWDKRSITYRVINGSSTLPHARAEALMAAGLGVWAPHGGLTFTKLDQGSADITVFFASGEHGDGWPFDGQGRVVAHAFPPPHGAMHFDDDEIWGDNDPFTSDTTLEEDEDVTDFFAVAVHEIGHALGLSHSNVKESVMYPYYQVPVETLHMDDILGVQELYLKNSVIPSDASTDVPQFTKTESDEYDLPDLCFTNYNTLQVIDGKIYVFEEEWVWIFKDRNELEPGSPRYFHDVFRGLPSSVSYVRTIYQRFNGNVAIFKGKSFWEFGKSGESGYRLVHRGKLSAYSLPSYVSELSTVFISNYNNKTYLIEEDRFWRYDEGARKMDAGYPKDMAAWRKVPSPVDAAIVWKEDTYFFRGPRFWRFDNTLVAAHDYYPLPVAQIWFGCPYTPEMNEYVVNDRLCSFFHQVNLHPLDAVNPPDTYFFRGPRFWRFDNTLVAAHDYYPLPVAQIWFGKLKHKILFLNRRKIHHIYFSSALILL